MWLLMGILAGRFLSSNEISLIHFYSWNPTLGKKHSNCYDSTHISACMSAYHVTKQVDNSPVLGNYPPHGSR